MKKAALTILILLYFTTSIGATVRMHFCMGELVSWTVNTKESDDKCSKCAMKCEKGCCEEKLQVVKIDKDQKLSIASFDFTKLSLEVDPISYQQWQASIVSFTVADFPKANAPPDKGKIPLFVRNSAFLL